MIDDEGRRLLRLSASYMLDQLATGRLIFDTVDTLIAVAASQANVAPLHGTRELQLRYATFDRPPPDDLRRPISISALAQSIRLPFETVRRRLVKLGLLGVVQSTPSGVRVPTGALTGPVHHRHLERNDTLTASLWGSMADRLEIGDSAEAATPVWTDPPLRIISRISLDYVLRLTDQLSEQFGDPISVAVWATILEADRTPISMQAISRRAQLSAETVRRRVHDLAGGGSVEIGRSGVVSAEAFMESTQFVRIVSRNRSDLVRMFAALRDLGVMVYWQARGTSQAA